MKFQIVCIGVACQTGGTDLTTFVIGRVFAGLGVGGTSCLVPMCESETGKIRGLCAKLTKSPTLDQSECAPRHIRGMIVGAYQWMITIGLLIAAVVVNATKDRNDLGSYAIPIGLQFAYASLSV